MILTLAFRMLHLPTDLIPHIADQGDRRVGATSYGRPVMSRQAKNRRHETAAPRPPFLSKVSGGVNS